MPATLTVTEKRISSQVQGLDPGLCKTYAKYFPRKRADEEFWDGEAQLEEKLMKTLAYRPLGIMRIKVACQAYTRGFLELCVAGRAREQGQASGATDPQGSQGAV